jgi:hypothetical protein
VGPSSPSGGGILTDPGQSQRGTQRVVMCPAGVTAGQQHRDPGPGPMALRRATT